VELEQIRCICESFDFYGGGVFTDVDGCRYAAVYLCGCVSFLVELLDELDAVEFLQPLAIGG